MPKNRPAGSRRPPPPAVPPSARSRAKAFLQALALVLVVGWIYWPALHGAWLWDDVTEISGNPLIHDPAGLAKIWFDPPGPDYFPLKSTVEWLQWQMWGVHSTGYHATSMVLHLLSAFALWRVLGKLGIRFAWLGALLFAVHPMAVESVAWVAELKNTLSLPLLLLALSAWLDFDERGGWANYFSSLGCFLAAMLCKTSVVMFPATLLLFAWWKRGRVGVRDLKVSAAFFAISAVLGLVTVWFQQHHAIGANAAVSGGLLSRIAVAGLAAPFYFFQCLLPLQPMPIYPRWAVDPPALWQFLPWILLALLAAWFWTKRQTWGRHALLGTGYFLLNLLPVLGLIPMSYMSITWVADHFAYLPLAVFAGCGAAGAGVAVRYFHGARWRFAVSVMAVLLLGLAYRSQAYAGKFRDEETFWSYALQVNPDAWLAHNNLGNTLVRAGRAPEALGHFEQALQLRPEYPEAHNNYGTALSQIGRWPEAVAQYEAALRLRPNYAGAEVSLANVLFQLGRLQEAIGHYQAGLQLQPDYPEAHNNLGSALAQVGRIAEAATQFEAEVRARPDYAPAHNNLGNALGQLDRLAESVAQYEEALRLQPDYADAHNNLGSTLLRLGRWQEARAHFQQVLRLRPDNARAWENLSRIEAMRPAAGAGR